VTRVASFAGQKSSAARAATTLSPIIIVDTSQRRFIGAELKVEG
jgi:hypothetical protein